MSQEIFPPKENNFLSREIISCETKSSPDRGNNSLEKGIIFTQRKYYYFKQQKPHFHIVRSAEAQQKLPLFYIEEKKDWRQKQGFVHIHTFYNNFSEIAI